MEGGGGGSGGVEGWSSAVEDMVDGGDVDGAISLLESLVSKLELDHSELSSLQLASALGDLADLHASRGFSLRADDLRSRALSLRAQAVHHRPSSWDSEPKKEKTPEPEEIQASSQSKNSLGGGEEEDDWEAVADRAGTQGEELLPSKQEDGVSLSTSWEEETERTTPKRRGRGSFLYRKSCLYSDQDDDGPASEHNARSQDEPGAHEEFDMDEADRTSKSRYGMGHVLVLYDFSPSTRTIELERLFDSFKDRGFAIRWVNDTTALAVFRTPSIAHEAQHSVHCPFKVRLLGQEDSLLNQLSVKDLEPPYPRPRTSARTAQRLIAQGMGIKPSTDFGSNELRKQEAERKNRIVARQSMRDDAWGSDDP